MYSDENHYHRIAHQWHRIPRHIKPMLSLEPRSFEKGIDDRFVSAKTPTFHALLKPCLDEDSKPLQSRTCMFTSSLIPCRQGHEVISRQHCHRWPRFPVAS